MGVTLRVFITGGTGLLGFHLIKAFMDKGYDVHASYHKRKPAYEGNIKWVYLDLEDIERINDVVDAIKPNIVVHSAAYTDVDGCENNKSLAYRVNYIATKTLAHKVSKSNSFMVYISTDYVFDGERGMYKEEDVPCPINFYGLTKLLGEVAIENKLHEKSLIIRVSGLYGYSPMGKKNFGLNALEMLTQGREVIAFFDQFLSPTYAYYLAHGVVKAIEKDVTGYLHLAGERMSRLEFALALAEALRVNKGLIKPVSINEAKLIAKRPRDSSLDTSKAHDLALSLPTQSECIKHFVEWYRRSRGLNDAF